MVGKHEEEIFSEVLILRNDKYVILNIYVSMFLGNFVVGNTRGYCFFFFTFKTHVLLTEQKNSKFYTRTSVISGVKVLPSTS